MTFPDTFPAWMTEQVLPMPAWCRGAGGATFTSHVPETGASTRSLQTPTMKIAPDLAFQLHQWEEALYGRVTRPPVSVRLWTRVDGDPIDLTAEHAQALGLAMIEHAACLREVQA